LTALNNIKLPPGTSNELAWQLQRYKRDVAALDVMPGDNVEGTLDRLTLAELTSSTFNIIRSFSFVGDPVYWTNVAEGHGPNGRRSVGRHVKLKRNAN
jgi:hypothetical protein